MTTPTTVVTDPIVSDPPKSPLLRGWADRILIDDRNFPFLSLIAQLTFILLPFAIALFVMPFYWYVGAFYLFLVLFVFLDKFILMVHNVSHIPTFKKGYGWLNDHINWVISPLMGHTPNTYFTHHIGMHHLEGNAPEDCSSTERFQRDSLFHFLRYFGRFMVWSMVDMSRYLSGKGRVKLLRRMLLGEVGYMIVVAGLLVWKPLPTLFVFVLPLVITRFLMMAGNWGQHAFVDEADPDNSYKNSITCINTRYNRRAYNDGYHIGHHLYPRMHWTELPKEFDENRATYRNEGALVFEGIDFFMVWAALMLKAYGYLARRYVRLDGDDREDAEIIALLKARTRPIPRALA